MRQMSGVLCALTVLALLTAPAMAQNQVLNASFEDDLAPADNWPDNWTGTATYKTDAEYGVTARTGTDYMRAASDNGVVSGTAQQSVALPSGPGQYFLTLSFHGWVHDEDAQPDSVMGEIIVDGGSVASVTMTTPEDAWTAQTVSWAGDVTTSISVKFTLTAQGTTTDVWDVVALDDVELIANNWVLNPSFENGNHVNDGSRPDHWTGGGDWKDSGWFGGANAHTGTKYMGAACNGDRVTATIQQSIGLPNGPAYYDLSLSFWAWLYDYGMAVDSVKGEIIVDGVSVASVTYSNSDVVQSGQYTTKPYGESTVDWAGVALTNITVKLTLDADGSSGWGVVALDDVELLINEVPCPNPTLLTDASPDSFSFPPLLAVDEPITITGTAELDLVTSVSLVHMSGFPTLPGTFTASPTETQISADFNLAPAVPGMYAVVAMRNDGCPYAVLPNAVEIGESTVNLLLNPSFEATGTRNAEIWFGNYATNDTGHVPSPQFIDGTRRWGKSQGGFNPVDHSLWQTVMVPAGDTVTFSGWVAVGPGNDCNNSATITLYDGAPTPGNEIGTPQVINESVPRMFGDPNYGWVRAEISGTANSGSVTVKVAVRLEPNGWWGTAIAAVHLDAFGLYDTTTACSTQHLLAEHSEANPNPDPRQGPHSVNPILTIKGTDLNLVTGVRLIKVDSATILNGYNLSTAPPYEQMTATIDFSGGPTIGLYDVVTDQASASGCCVSRVIVDGFEVILANPTVFDSLDPSTLNTPQGSRQFTIHGHNLDQLNVVSLIQHNEGAEVTTIPGTIDDDSDPEAILVTFNLTDKPLGYYDLTGTRGDGYAAPADLSPAFKFIFDGAVNLLANSSLEDDLEPDPVDEWPDHWPKSTPPENQKVHWINPGWYWGAGPHTGNKAVGAASNYMTDTGSIEQSLGLPANQPADHDFTLMFWAWLYDNSLSANPSYVKGEIIVDGESKASASLEANGQGGIRYTPVSLHWSGWVSTDVTIKISLKGEGQGGWGSVAVDDLELISPILCHDPFADVDEDGDVDMEDFGIWQTCYTGGWDGHESIPAEPEYCGVFNRDPDDDIDEVDLLAFEACWSAPGIEADICCDGGNGCPP